MTNQEQNTDQRINISQDNEYEYWIRLFEMQHQNMIELIRIILYYIFVLKPLTSIMIMSPEFNCDIPELALSVKPRKIGPPNSEKTTPNVEAKKPHMDIMR